MTDQLTNKLTLLQSEFSLRHVSTEKKISCHQHIAHTYTEYKKYIMKKYSVVYDKCKIMYLYSTL